MDGPIAIFDSRRVCLQGLKESKALNGSLAYASEHDDDAGLQEVKVHKPTGTELLKLPEWNI